jgi:hypothetical protein
MENTILWLVAGGLIGRAASTILPTREGLALVVVDQCLKAVRLPQSIPYVRLQTDEPIAIPHTRFSSGRPRADVHGSAVGTEMNPISETAAG